MDPQWSETGDRYMLKLYRDFLFHQHDANGAPWIDMAHILQSLNKVKSIKRLESALIRVKRMIIYQVNFLPTLQQH